MPAPQNLTKADMLAQLRREGVTDLDSLADFLIRKTHQDGDPNKPIVNAAIVYNHGFVSH
ncbi:MAG TPA: hypothetical protein VHG08_10935 [Longimicrobium sp.]|nr:hypothetical protein [Longimicrobium sp.]